MSRIRSIHPGLFTDEAFVVLSPMARIFFMGLWTECDDAGSFEWSPLKLKMRLLPADAVDAGELLNEIERERGIIRYEIAGKSYGAVRNFCQYQRPKKPNCIHPQTDEIRAWVNIDARSTRDGSPPVPHRLPLKPEKPRLMEDGGGNKKDLSNDKSSADDFPNRVVEVWNAAIVGTPLPRAHKLTADRLKHLRTRLKDYSQDDILTAIRNMAASDWHSGKSGEWTNGNLGWLLNSPENFTKMLERGQAAPPAKPSGPPLAGGSLFARFQAGEITQAEFETERSRLEREQRQTSPPSEQRRGGAASIGQIAAGMGH